MYTLKVFCNKDCYVLRVTQTLDKELLCIRFSVACCKVHLKFFCYTYLINIQLAQHSAYTHWSGININKAGTNPINT